MQFNTETVNKILDIDDSYKAPEALMKIMMDPSKREIVFDKFLAVSSDLSFDWFHEYYEDEQSQRKSKKQDFTPEGVAKLMALLAEPSEIYFEAAAGTGGIMITSWNIKPAKYYQVEEMSDRAVPFLLFNMAIRNMKGHLVQCDSLTRKTKEIYEIDGNEVTKLNHSEENERKFDVREWVEKF